MTPTLIFITVALVLFLLFYFGRSGATLVRARTLACAIALIGIITLLTFQYYDGRIDVLGTCLLIATCAACLSLGNKWILFNFSGAGFDAAAEDSATRLLMSISAWSGNTRAVESATGALTMTLAHPLPRTAFMLYTITKTSAKVSLYKQLLAKHFSKALPRIKIKMK